MPLQTAFFSCAGTFGGPLYDLKFKLNACNHVLKISVTVQPLLLSLQGGDPEAPKQGGGGELQH